MGHLNIAKNQVYQALADRLDKNPVGAPMNQTLLEILYRMYSETQAMIGSRFPMQPAGIEQIAEVTGLDPTELSQHLEDMANKGLVIDIPKHGSTFYMLSPLVVGFFEYTFMRVNPNLPMQELAELFEAYHHEQGVTREFFGGDTKFFQALAYESLMPGEVETEVLTFEKASQIIRDSGGGSLTMCYCRHQAQHLGRSCNAPIEDVCISLGSASQWLIRRGFARPASVDELLSVLERTEELGLVHLGDNVQNNPAYICNCCGCCCGVLRAAKEDGALTAHPSNFIPHVKLEGCTGCGACAKRCHVEAITLFEIEKNGKKGKQARVDEGKCIGCGACIRGCKSAAIKLVQRKEIYVPPKNKKEQMLRIAQGKVKNLG